MYLYCCQTEGSCCTSCKLPIDGQCSESGFEIETWSQGYGHQTLTGTRTQDTDMEDVCCRTDWRPLNNACQRLGNLNSFLKDTDKHLFAKRVVLVLRTDS